LNATPDNERRGIQPRGRVLLSGKVVYGNGDMSHDCVIRDQTDKGARIKVESAVPLPQQIYLIDYKKGVAYFAEVAWSAPPHHGLKYARTLDLRDEGAKDPFYKLLRRLYLERVAR
jgi:hypothetical protein